MPTILVALAVLAGLVACFALSNLLTWRRDEQDHSTRYFGLVCLAFAAYVLLQLHIFTSRDLASAAVLLRWQGVAIACLFAALVRFGVEFGRRTLDRLDILYISVYLFLGAWSLLSSSGYWFATITALEPIPSTNGLMVQPRGPFSWTYYLSIAVQYPLLLRQILDGHRAVKAGQRIDGWLWIASIAMVLILGTHDHLVDFGLLTPPYLAEYPFPLAMLTMGTRYAQRRSREFARLRRLKQALADSEAKLRELYESSSDAIFIHDAATGSILDVNRTMCEMYGYQRRECLGLTVADLSASGEEYSLSRARERLNQALKDGIVTFPWRARRKDQSLMPVEVTLKRTELDGKTCVVANVRNQAAHEANIEALRESEERYRTLFDSAGDAILLMREDQFVDCNELALQVYGCNRREQLIGHSPQEFSPEHQPNGAPSSPQALERIAAALSGTPQRFEWTHRRADGATFTAEVSLNRVVLQGVNHLQAIVRDVTEKRRLEDRLRHAQRLESIGHLAGGVAHDFNNLLTPIMGHVELLLEDLPTADPSRDDLEQVLSAANRARRLIQQLLSVGRKGVLEIQPVDMCALILGMRRLIERLLREDIELVVEVDPDSVVVTADPSQIEQVVINLVVNARDAMPNGGRLTVAVARRHLDAAPGTTLVDCAPGDYAQVSIGDTGIGMAEEVRLRLFEPFFTTKAHGHGTGLGLPTVLGIVEQHRGTLTVTSTPGTGSTLSVYLPLAKDQQVRIRDSVVPSPHGIATATILVVEDEESVRAFACRALERHGYKVFSAKSAECALRALDELPTPPHLVLTDVVLPKMNGRQLFDQLHSRLPGIRVLYMSGYSGETITHHGVLNSGVVLLQKPFSVDQLLTKVQLVLDG